MKAVESMKPMKKMKRNFGNTLVEVIMSLFVLAIIMPTSLGALGSVLMVGLKTQENAYLISSAEWWFTRMTFPVYIDDIDAAPRADRHGKIRFDWDTEGLENGAIRVTLRVYGRLAARPLTVVRIL